MSNQYRASSDPSHHSDLATRIDHTYLKPDAAETDIRKACAEALEYGFATVCVRSNWVGLASELLKGSKSLPISVVDFPEGKGSTEARVSETRKAVQDGAREIDVVIALPRLLTGDRAGVLSDLKAVVQAARPYPVKVILETSTLNQEQKILGCELSKEAGAAFVKTSTGFASGGATVEDIRLMRKIVGPDMGVKASGGIRTREDALQMIEAGANRIGASSGIAIVTGSAGAKGAY